MFRGSTDQLILIFIFFFLKLHHFFLLFFDWFLFFLFLLMNLFLFGPTIVISDYILIMLAIVMTVNIMV